VTFFAIFKTKLSPIELVIGNPNIQIYIQFIEKDCNLKKEKRHGTRGGTVGFFNYFCEVQKFKIKNLTDSKKKFLTSK